MRIYMKKIYFFLIYFLLKYLFEVISFFDYIFFWIYFLLVVSFFKYISFWIYHISRYNLIWIYSFFDFEYIFFGYILYIMKSLWIVITFDITDMKRYFFHGYFQENVDFLDISDINGNNCEYIQKSVYKIYPKNDIFHKFIKDISVKSISICIYPWIYPIFGYFERYFVDISKISMNIR